MANTETGSNRMQVEFVSPEDLFYSGEAESVIARTRGGGDIAFLAGHEPFIGSLITSIVQVAESSDQVKKFAVRGGFVSVNGSKVTILSDAALAADQINREETLSELEEVDSKLVKDPNDEYLLADKQWAEVQLSLTQ